MRRRDFLLASLMHAGLAPAGGGRDETRGDFGAQIAEKPLLQRDDRRCAQILLITPADSRAIIPALIKALRSSLLVINLENKLDNRALASHGVWHSLCRPQQFQRRARWETMCCGP